MTPDRKTDWNPGAYDRFRGLRLQPAMDLLARVGDLTKGSVIDLGCGNGVMGEALRMRFPDRQVLGVDNSPAMLEKAASRAGYDALQQADIATWSPKDTTALIYSNAALQWLDDHESLLPRLAGLLAPSGVLAVQVPFQNPAPSHAGWNRAFGRLFPGMSVARGPSILDPEAYFDLLSGLGDLQVWQTEYIQHLDAAPGGGHPVRLFTESTYARPFLTVLSKADQERLIASYEEDISQTYKLRGDGSCLFPFRRLFFVLRVA